MTAIMKRRRIQVVMPERLFEEVDALAGKRRRSQFITEAVEEKLGHRRPAEAFEQVVGSSMGADTPDWETRESAAKWVGDLGHDSEKSAPLDPEPDE